MNKDIGYLKLDRMSIKYNFAYESTIEKRKTIVGNCSIHHIVLTDYLIGYVNQCWYIWNWDVANNYSVGSSILFDPLYKFNTDEEFITFIELVRS